MYTAPVDNCDGQYERDVIKFEYGSLAILAKVLKDTTIVGENIELTEFSLGLTKEIESGDPLTDPQNYFGDGLLGLSPVHFKKFAEKAGMEEITQFLFDGRNGQLTFGDFSDSSGFEWIDWDQLGVDDDAWTAPSRSTSVGSVHFDTGAEGIYLRESNVLEYFGKKEWPAGSVRLLDDYYYIQCDLVSSPGIEALMLEIEMDVEMTELAPFDVGLEWLIGPPYREADMNGKRFCESLLQVLEPHPERQTESELG